MPADLVALSRALEPPPGYVPPPRFARLFPYQQATLAQSPLRRHLLLAHAPGLGKTPMALAVTDQAMLGTLIICPPTIVGQWQEKIEEWLGLEVNPTPCITGKQVSGLTQQDMEAGPIIVSDSLVHLIRSDIFPLALIVDEVHRFKSLATRRSIYMFGGTYHSVKIHGVAQRARRVIGLTGTPLQSTPVDLYPFLHVCAPTIAPSFKAYTERYCPPTEMRIPGARFPVKRYDLKVQNLEELAVRLRETVMIRPAAADCQTQLPPLIEDSYHLVIEDPARGVSAEEIAAVLAGDRTASEQEAEAVSTMRRETGMAKATSAMLRAWLGDLIEAGERPLIWCWHQGVAESLALALEIPFIHGGVPIPQRQAIVSRFRAGQAAGIAITIAAAGTGLDGLQQTGALAVFVEQAYVPGDNDQAVARLHRVGQTRGVRVVVVRTSAVVDRAIDSILRRKNTTVGKVLS